MENIVSNTTGLLHLIVSVIALVTGIMVLTMTKGTKTHKQIGYVYAVSMVLVNLTAFMIYKLYGKFGLFHWFAVISCVTLFAGLYPVLTKKSKDYLLTHFNFMYWSVVGLYCAFMAEIFSRLPKIVLTADGKPMTVFYKGVGIGIAVVMVIAVAFFIKYKPIWTKQYEQK
jgi:uncharacterized membrane protein